MKKIIAYCKLGYHGAEIKDELELDDTYTKEDIEEEVYNWAFQFLKIRWEEKESED